MSSLNKVTLIGRLGQDPNVNITQSGKKYASFSIATSETWKDKATGDKKEKTEWHNVFTWNDSLVSVIENYVKKGSRVYVEGKLTTEKQEKDGITKYFTKILCDKILLLDSKNSQEQSYDYHTSVNDSGLDDEVPF